MTQTDLHSRLARAPVVPLIQADDPTVAIDVARALVAGGLTVLEVVLRTEAALHCLREVAAAVPEAIVGAGTVLSDAQATASLEAGAAFIVSPGLDPKVVAAAQSAGADVIPGVATATEAQAGYNLGLPVLKFFPAGQAGGVSMLRALAAVFRDLRFMPTGGVSADNLADYLALDAVIACGGSWLTPMSAIAHGDYETVTHLATEACAIARKVRG
ncbi:MAG: bifunctional 4-hydroxy-2-oxoglutarate aldolase/2-dehydro-3-deoxy-phosphogluconate aldolase [Pseudomonadota bacterium]